MDFNTLNIIDVLDDRKINKILSNGGPWSYKTYLNSSTDWNDVAENVISEESIGVYEKARDIYHWMITTFEYGQNLDGIDSVLKSKKGVCQEFAQIFYHVGRAVGLDVRIITGVIKNNRGKINNKSLHSWIIVNKEKNNECVLKSEYVFSDLQGLYNALAPIDGLKVCNCIIIDPTWGINYSDKKEGKFDYCWFDVNPIVFQTSHWTFASDQFYDRFVSWDEFNRTPFINPHITDYHIDTNALFNKMKVVKHYLLPNFYNNINEYIDLISIPLDYYLKSGKTYTIIVKKKKPCTLGLISNDIIVDTEKKYFSKWITDEAECSSINFKAYKKDIAIAINNDDSSTYHYAVQYKVIGKITWWIYKYILRKV